MSHIGIMLTAAPFQFENWETAVNLADAAIEKGYTVSLFLYIDGVYNPLQRQSHPLYAKLPYERFLTLLEKKAHIVLCGTSASLRGISSSDCIDGVVIGGLPDFALMLSEVDRLVCL
jgi:sulfur relay (sulfurtransferase) complex TusBCD TusD component (DsrE family)